MLVDIKLAQQYLTALLGNMIKGGGSRGYLNVAGAFLFVVAAGLFVQRVALAAPPASSGLQSPVSTPDKKKGGSVTLLPTSLSFGSQVIGTVSAPRVITLSNDRSQTLKLKGISFTAKLAADYHQVYSCPAKKLKKFESCTISITFTPTGTGDQPGEYEVFDNAAGSPQTVLLDGTGLAAGATGTPTITPTATSTNTASATPTVTQTSTATASATATHTVTASPTATATGTGSPTRTATATSTNTASATPTVTQTSTATASATATPTVTASPTATATGTGSPTRTATATTTNTASATQTVTQTSTATASATATPTLTASPTATPTTVPLAVLSFTPTSAVPGALLTISGTGFDSTAAPLIVFAETNGPSIQVPPVSVTSTAVTVAIPPFLDPTTGAFSAGSDSVAVSQTQGAGTVSSNAVTGLMVQSLPMPASVPGTLTLAFLQAEQNYIASNLEFSVALTAFDTPDLDSALANEVSALNAIIPGLTGVMIGALPSYTVGTFDGQNVTVTTKDLLNMDRVLLGMLSAQASSSYSISARTGQFSVVPLASDPPGCGASEAATAYNDYTTNANPDSTDFSNYLGAPQTSAACAAPQAIQTGLSVVIGSAAVGLGLMALFLPAEGVAAAAALPMAGIVYITLVAAGGEIGIGGALQQTSGAALQLVQNGMNQLEEFQQTLLLKGLGLGVLKNLGVDNPEGKLALTGGVFGCHALWNAFTSAPPFGGGPPPPTTFTLATSTTGPGTGTVTSYPGTIDCGTGGSFCSVTYPAGATVVLNAEADLDSTFGAWSGSCSGSGSCQVTMNSNQSVNAQFNQFTCSGSLTNCNGECVDLTSDPGNCGACGSSCSFGGTCQGSTCGCSTGESACLNSASQNVCTDTQTDNNNCGFCGDTCSSGQSCVGGSCVSGCTGTTTTNCGGTCTNTQNDTLNCGTCGSACGGGERCQLGACFCYDPDAFTDPDDDPDCD